MDNQPSPEREISPEENIRLWKKNRPRIAPSVPPNSKTYIPDKYPNWRSVIETLPSLATFLAGFSLTLMSVLLRDEVKTYSFVISQRALYTHVTAGVMLTTAVLCFILSLLSLLRARASNRYDIKESLTKKIEERVGANAEDYWAKIERQCEEWYERGVKLFNSALILLMVGAGVLFCPYSILLAILFFIGAIIEFVWLLCD